MNLRFVGSTYFKNNRIFLDLMDHDPTPGTDWDYFFRNGKIYFNIVYSNQHLF